MFHSPSHPSVRLRPVPLVLYLHGEEKSCGGGTGDWRASGGSKFDPSQMLHGAGIFTYIETPSMTQFCRDPYSSTMDHLGIAIETIEETIG